MIPTVSNARLTGFVAAILALAACSDRTPAPPPAAVAAPYVAVARGRVDVEGGPVSLAMPIEARLRTVLVHEGDVVRRGQVLAEGDGAAAGFDTRAAVAKQAQAQARVHALETRLASVRDHARRLASAAAAGAGDGQSADDAAAEAAQLAADVASARADATMAELDASRARQHVEQLVLRSPVDADVVRVAAREGSSVSPQSGPVVVLLPRGPRIVRAELPETFANAVPVGMPAEVSLDDDSNGVVARGHVVRVSPMLGTSPPGDDPNVRAGEQNVECVVALDAASRLRVGQRVIVRFPKARAAR